MNLILNIIGIILVIYSISLILKDSEDDSFDSESFLQEVNDFSQLLDQEKDKIVEEDDKDLMVPPKYINKESRVARSSSYDSGSTESSGVRDEVDHGSLVRDLSEGKRKRALNPESKKVLVLKDLGLTIEDIARETDRSIREVEVILKLNNKL